MDPRSPDFLKPSAITSYLSEEGSDSARYADIICPLHNPRTAEFEQVSSQGSDNGNAVGKAYRCSKPDASGDIEPGSDMTGRQSGHESGSCCQRSDMIGAV
jgi:hypothetical protein